MNTIQRWELTATVQDPERAKFWLEYLNTDTVPVVSQEWCMVQVVDRGIIQAYFLDVKALSAKQIKSLAAGLAKVFGEDLAQTEQNIFLGVPILAEDVVIKRRGKVVAP